MNKKKIIITTSWDDGQFEDLKLLKLLNKYRIKSTFYIPLSFKNKHSAIKKLAKEILDCGNEIGAHTVSHASLSSLSPNKAFIELVKSKLILEEISEKKIVSFSYPNGKFNREAIKLVKSAGYRIGRTTVGFQTTTFFNPYTMPTSLQFFPHNKITHIKHALKENNFSGLFNWIGKYNMESNLFLLSQSFLKEILNFGGIFHIWGHSWEIEKYSLWGQLENVFKLIGRINNVKYLTNEQTLIES